MTAAKVIPIRDWKYFDQRLTELRMNDVANIIERGRVLIEMKATLEHGSYEATVKRHMDLSDARKYRTIAVHRIISNRGYNPALPPSMRTLYELTKLPNEILLAKLNDGTINPKTEQKQAKEIVLFDKDPERYRANQERNEKIAQAILAGSSQDEVTAACECGNSTFTKIRRQLIAEGKLIPRQDQELIDAIAHVARLLKVLPVAKRVEAVRQLLAQSGVDLAALASDAPQTKLVWKPDPKRADGIVAEDYLIVPTFELGSGKTKYMVSQGNQPELPDKRHLAINVPTQVKAKAIAQRDWNQRQTKVKE